MFAEQFFKRIFWNKFSNLFSRDSNFWEQILKQRETKAPLVKFISNFKELAKI